MTLKKLSAGLLVLSLVSQSAMAATTLSKNERTRVAHAKRSDRAELTNCFIARKKAQKKGTVIGAAGVGAGAAIVGGNLGESLLGAGVGALAGNQIGKESGTSKRCHTLLQRYP